MDSWKYFDITHREHTFCNPMSSQKIDRLIDLLRLEANARVLEIASGKGEFLVRLAERYRIQGVGVDASPYCIADARAKHRERVPDTRLTFIEMDGATYQPDKPNCFDLVACIGASWIFGGHRGTLQALAGMAARDSWIVVGEPFWRREPEPAYLEAAGLSRESFATHEGNIAAGKQLGLDLAYTLVSSRDDWDTYEGLQWYATETWACRHPDDPDLGEVLERTRDAQATYLRWGRETLGWAIYLFRQGRAEL